MALAPLLMAGVVACQRATEVSLEVSTDAICEDVSATSITTGSLESVEAKPPNAVTEACEPSNGRIGSITIVPSGEEDAEFAIRVVTGLVKSPERCVADGYMGGCIVARRLVSFIPNQRIVLPVEMAVDCVDVPCGLTETCWKGECVSARIEDPTVCTDPGGCVDAGPDEESTRPDGGFPDGSVPPNGDGGSAGTGGTAGSAGEPEPMEAGTAGGSGVGGVIDGGASGSGGAGSGGAGTGGAGSGGVGGSSGVGGAGAGGSSGVGGSGGTGTDGSVPDGGGMDGSVPDGGAMDGSVPDGGIPESGMDGSASDSGGADGSVPDGCATDGGAVYGPPGPSCDGMTGTECQGESCCLSILVPCGTFPMGRSEDGTDAVTDGDPDEQPEHDATVDDFYMDAFEVTVGRFRRFVEQYDGTPPPDGAGASPLIAGSGWQSSWNALLPSSQAALIDSVTCSSSQQTWKNSPGSNDNYPINCVSWYEAFAFCAWDGGRLPTEAEWEYAAAGGNQNRLYPWGTQPPDATLANYYDGDNSPRIDVGSYPAGQGRWGHRDLCGSLWEWALDGYSDTWYANGDCDNCAQLVDTSDRVFRGASWVNNGELLRAARRLYSLPSALTTYKGFRCVRSP